MAVCSPSNKMLSQVKKLRLSYLFFGVSIFFLTFVFFYNIHPLVIFDTDDWCYLTYPREAVPIPSSWNPTRIFPEVIMPFASAIASYIISPFAGGYLEAITWTNALVASVFIAVYITSFVHFLRKHFGLQFSTALMFGCIFFLMHFFALRGLDSDNPYLFWSINVTSFYFYVLPNIFCATCLLYIISSNCLDSFFQPKHLVKKSLLLLCLYLALFSNLFASVIIGSYVGIVLCVRLTKAIASHASLKLFCLHNGAWAIIAIVWVAIQCLEAFGGRAASLSEDVAFSTLLQETLQALLTLPINGSFVAMCIVAAILFVIVILVNHLDKKRKNIYKLKGGFYLTLFFSGMFCFVYAFLVAAKATPQYIARADVIFSAFFYLMILGLSCTAYIVRCLPRTILLFPVLMLLMVFSTYTGGNTFKEVNIANLAPEKSYAITKDIINQIQEANDDAKSTVDLHVPVSLAKDNWPLAVYAGENNYFSRTALKAGLIANDIKIVVIPDIEKNYEFALMTNKRFDVENSK